MKTWCARSTATPSGPSTARRAWLAFGLGFSPAPAMRRIVPEAWFVQHDEALFVDDVDVSGRIDSHCRGFGQQDVGCRADVVSGFWVPRPARVVMIPEAFTRRTA